MFVVTPATGTLFVLILLLIADDQPTGKMATEMKVHKTQMIY